MRWNKYQIFTVDVNYRQINWLFVHVVKYTVQQMTDVSLWISVQ